MEDEAKTRSRSTLSTIVTVAVCIWAVYLAVDLMQEPFQVELPQQNKDTPVQYKHLPWGKPPVLMSYGEFCKRSTRGQQTNVEHSHRSIMFNFFVLVIGRQNFATVAGLSSFYMQQHLLYADLTLDEQNNLDTVPLSNSNITYIDERGQPDEMIAASSLFNEAIKQASDFKMPAGIEQDRTDCLEEVRNQKRCGACYAFAIYALMEWHYCKQSGGTTKVDFSEQHMIDCGHEWGLNGCKGGMFTNARRFINNYGVKYEKDYPYKASQTKFKEHIFGKEPSECPKHVHSGAFKTKLRTEEGFNEWVRIERSRENLENAVKEQPIAVEVHMPVFSQLSLSGIDDGKWCTETKPHGMLLVGYGTEKGVPYWLLRNSHGRMVNSNGYFRLKRDISDASMKSCIRSAFIARPFFEPLGKEAQTALYESFKINVKEAPKKVMQGGVMKRILVHSAKK